MGSMVPTSEVDLLDEDKPLRGQNFVCLSFLSPEDVLVNKEVFLFGKFLQSISKPLEDLLNGLRTKYPQDADTIDVVKENYAYFFNDGEVQDQYKFFKSVNGQALEKAFQEQNDFRTSVRGIKVRGVFDTLKEAQVRADVLKKMGDKFDIYVGQVGCWCPWSPDPHDLDDQRYAETQLNTLMMKYKENMEARDEHYQQRKDDKIKKAKEALEAAKKLNEATAASEAAEAGAEAGDGAGAASSSSEPSPADSPADVSGEQPSISSTTEALAASSITDA